MINIEVGFNHGFQQYAFSPSEEKLEMTQTRILVVDDEVGIARLCKRLLEQAGYEVIISTHPYEAIRLLSEQRFDVLVTDVRMPLLDGFELVNRARMLQSDLAVLLMTGFGTVETAIQALHRGVDGLILKPFESSEDLVRSVEQVLRDYRSRIDANRLHILRPLFEINEEIFTEDDPAVLTAAIEQAFIAQFQTYRVEIFTKNEHGWESIADHTEIDLNSKLVIDIELNKACETNTAYLVTSEENEEGLFASWLLLHAYKDALIVPVMHRGRWLVYISLRKNEAREIREPDLEFAMILGRQSSIALENIWLVHNLNVSLRQLSESQKKLILAEKMSALGRLMANVAHEVNNPLQAVQNCLHLAIRNDVSHEQKNEYLLMARGEIERLSDFVQGALEFYRPSGVEKQIISMGEVIQKTLNLIQTQLKQKQIECHISIQENLPKILAVRDQLQQVFLNLFINAMDAVQGCPDPKQIWIDACETDQFLEITIEDSGPGIPYDFEGKIFEPFVSTKSGGTGLGLSISYEIIVDVHQGQLEICPPRYGQGACFRIQIPKGSTQ